MATIAEQPGSPALEQLRSDRRWLGLGFCWGGILLGLLAIWLGARELEIPILIIFMFAWAVLTVGIGIWLIWPARTTDVEESALRQQVANQQRSLGLVLFGYTVVLLALAAWLTSLRGLPSFGEISSMVLLAFIAAVSGLALRGRFTGRINQEAILNWLVQKRPAVMMVLLIGGIVMMLLGIILLLMGGLSNLWGNFPERGGLVLLGLVITGCGLWSLLSNSTELTAQQMRLLVLILGGLSGLVISLMTALQIIAWWSDVFTAGMQVWQGQDSWKLWICVYVELLGLAIMFGSLLLVRENIHASVILRRMLYGYNAVVTGVLLLAILVVLNVLAYTVFPLTFEWTRTRGLQSLSDSSKGILERLKEPVTVYALVGDNSIFSRDVKILLNNCQAYSSRVEVLYISPDRDQAEYLKLAEKYPELKREQQIKRDRFDEGDRRGLLVAVGPDTGDKRPHAFIALSSLGDRKIDEKDRSGRSVTISFKGEDALMEKIQMLSEKGVKPIVYFTQKNGELWIQDQIKAVTLEELNTGAGSLQGRLAKDNYDVRGLIWGPPRAPFQGNPLFTYSRKDAKGTDEVPADASMVVIAYPYTIDEPFIYPKNGMEALERYLAKGGKLLVLNPNPVMGIGIPQSTPHDTGLSAFLKNYGVQVTKEFVINSTLKANRQLEYVSPTWVQLATPPAMSQNKVARSFANQRVEMVLPRVIRSIPGGKFRAEVLLEVKERPGEKIWADTEVDAILNPLNYVRNLIAKNKLDAMQSPEPLPVAMGVTDQKDKPMMVIVGDSRNAANHFINRSGHNFYDFTRSSMEWLVERPVAKLGIPPREVNNVVIPSTSVQHPERMVWLPLGLCMVLVIGIGAGVWVVRRR